MDLALLLGLVVAQTCASDAECGRTSLCTARPEQALTCHRRCQLRCAGDERCTVLRPPDDERWPRERRRYVCTAEDSRLCQPCERHADCEGFLDRCLILLSGEKACGRDCSWDDACPRGYRCADPGGFDGRVARRQCLPEAGCCACDQGFLVLPEPPPSAAAATTPSPGAGRGVVPSGTGPGGFPVTPLPAARPRPSWWHSTTPSWPGPATTSQSTPPSPATPRASQPSRGTPAAVPSPGQRAPPVVAPSKPTNW